MRTSYREVRVALVDDIGPEGVTQVLADLECEGVRLVAAHRAACLLPGRPPRPRVRPPALSTRPAPARLESAGHADVRARTMRTSCTLDGRRLRAVTWRPCGARVRVCRGTLDGFGRARPQRLDSSGSTEPESDEEVGAVSLLERIGGPRDLKALPAEQLPALAEEIRAFLVDEVSRTGGHLGPEPRRRRADHRDPPGLRLPARRGRLRHRPPVLRPQAAHRPARLLRPAQGGGPVRLPEPRRVRARRRRELARLDLAVLGRRHRRRPGRARRARPAHRRGHR